MSQTVSHNDLSPALRVRKFIGSMMPPGMKRAIVRTPAYLDLLRYTAPNIFRPSVPISTRAQGWLRELRENGIVRIEPEMFRGVADYLDRTYFAKLAGRTDHNLDGSEFDDKRLFTIDGSSDSFRAFGVVMTCEISLLDNSLAPMLRNPDIAGVIYNYYHRQPYYRNQPRIQFTDVKADSRVELGNDYHVDRFRQVSAMLLVSDQTVNDTHMEYLLGSHQRSFMKTGIEMTYEECRRWAQSAPERIFHLIGKKGTLFIYDTTGVHCRNLIPNSRRKVFIWTVTTGHHVEQFLDRTTDWPELAQCPPHVRHMFGQLDTNRKN
jgi:hypothetical protein